MWKFNFNQKFLLVSYFFLVKVASSYNIVPIRSLDQWLQTPFGLVAQKDVIGINQYETIKILPNLHIVKINRITKAIITDYGIQPQNITNEVDPFKYATQLRIAYLRANRSTTKNSADLFDTKTDQHGHIADAKIKHVKSFYTTWVVPSPPKKSTSKSIYFLWNGLARGALQPVLQWGGHAACYQIANWAFMGGKYIHGRYINVNSGSQLTGVISLESYKNGNWNYKESFVGYPEADLYVTRKKEANNVIECFEAYTHDLNKWPENLYTSMENIHLNLWLGKLPKNLNWHIHGKYTPTPSEKNTVIVSKSSKKGRIDFYFH